MMLSHSMLSRFASLGPALLFSSLGCEETSSLGSPTNAPRLAEQAEDDAVPADENETAEQPPPSEEAEHNNYEAQEEDAPPLIRPAWASLDFVPEGLEVADFDQ